MLNSQIHTLKVMRRCGIFVTPYLVGIIASVLLILRRVLSAAICRDILGLFRVSAIVLIFLLLFDIPRVFLSASIECLISPCQFLITNVVTYGVEVVLSLI